MKKTLLLTALLVSFNCVSNLTYFKAYPGPELPTSELALVCGGFWKSNGKNLKTTFEGIDGQPISRAALAMRGEGYWRIKISPGKHILHTTTSMGLNAARMKVELDAKAGMKYHFQPEMKPEGFKVHWDESPITEADLN